MSPDSTTVQFKNILGKVVIKVPQLGRIQQFLSTSSGWLLVVVIPAVLIIFNDILKIFKLTGAKKKVSHALQTEEEKAKQEVAKKEEIKVELKRRYHLDREIGEPDPLPTNQKLTKISKENSKEIMSTPKFELPKLKKVEETSPNQLKDDEQNESKKKPRKKKKTKDVPKY